MVMRPELNRNIDPNHEQLHKVRYPDMERYKQGVQKKVGAVCGKVWAPTIPFNNRAREMPKCPGCFPPSEAAYVLAN